MVVLFSRYANESEHIANEVDTAFSRKIDIIPFNIDGSAPNDEFGYYLRRMQWIDANGNYHDKISELIDALKNKLGRANEKVPNVGITAAISQPFEQGDAEVQYIHGAKCYFGDGVPQNYDEAVRSFRLSAEQGYAAAQYSLGKCYENGQGVPQSYSEAVKWYRIAADQGDPDAKKALDRLIDKN